MSGFLWKSFSRIYFKIRQDNKIYLLRLRLHSAIYRSDSLVLVLRYRANLKAIGYESTSLNRIVADESHRVIIASLVRAGRLQLHGEIYRPDSFVLMLCYCANLKVIRYESTSLNRIVADKSHRLIVAE